MSKPAKRYYLSAPVPYKLHRQIVGLARKYKKDKAFMVRELLRLGIALRYPTAAGKPAELPTVDP